MTTMTAHRFLGLLAITALAAAATGNEVTSNVTLDVNDIPQRYDEAQLWRIYNISEGMLQKVPVGEVLENKFGGNIWKENSKFLDISITKDQLKGARSFLSAHRLDAEVLSDNIQSMIDEEMMEGIRESTPANGLRTSRWKRGSWNQTCFYLGLLLQKRPRGATCTGRTTTTWRPSTVSCGRSAASSPT